MNLIFCGTPAFAVPTLEAVLAAGHQVKLVATQPDRAVGRSAQLTAPATKLAALKLGLSVLQPEKIKNNAEFRAQLEALAPDAILIVAYGRIIPKWMLDLPRLGNLNLHASLLPKYRGAAPIQWAVASGEHTTGVTTMRIDEGLDTGDILLQQEFPIGPHETSVDIFPRLAKLGAELMVQTLAGLEAGTIQAKKQNASQATHAPILTREDARVDFYLPAAKIYDRWRGFQPWPGAYTTVGEKKLTLHHVIPATSAVANISPGTIKIENSQCLVACGEGTWLQLLEVQAEGKKRLSIAEFLRGSAWNTGMVFGS